MGLSNWGEHCFIKYKDRRTFKKLKAWREFLLEKSRDFPSVQIAIKLQMISSGCVMGNMSKKRMKEIVKPLLKKHYGILPNVAMTIFQNLIWGDNEEKYLEIYL